MRRALASSARNAKHNTTGVSKGASSPAPRASRTWDGKPVDPARHFIVCANVIGSCMGSSGPASLDSATGEPHAMRFPVITIADMVRAQAMLLDHLGVERIAAVIGGSMGGMQALT